MKKNNSSRFPRESSWRSRPSVESKSRDTLSLSLSPVPLCRITTGTREGRRGETARVRTVIRESFHPLKSGTLLRLLHRAFLLPSSYRYTRTTFITRARTEDRTRRVITSPTPRTSIREEKGREEEEEGMLVGCPSLNRNAVCHGLKSPQMDPPGKGR